MQDIIWLWRLDIPLDLKLASIVRVYAEITESTTNSQDIQWFVCKADMDVASFDAMLTKIVIL